MYKYEIVRLDYPLPLRIVTLDYPRLRGKKTSNEMHWHDEIEVILSLEGEMITYINNKSVTVKEGDILVINSNDIHCSKLLEDTHVYKGFVLQIDSHFIKHVCHHFDNVVFHREFDELSKKHIRNIIMDIIAISKQQNLYSPIYVQGKLMELIYYLLLNSSERINDKTSIKVLTYKKRIQEMIDYIHANYNKDINAKSMSDIFNMSEGHLVKLFKEYVGITPKDYINTYRLDKAVNALTLTDDSVIDIAFNHGFTNIKSFYMLFNKKYNMTPKEYRKLNIEK